MDFDSLVARLELSLLPVVRADEERLRASGKFTSVEVVSLRHGDVIHALGIACRPTWAAMDLERLGFCATLTGMTGLSGRMDIQWSQVFTPRTGSGYLKRETKGFHSELESESEIDRFEDRWRQMAGLFRRVAARGRPSAYFLRRLRGAPRDHRGWKYPAPDPEAQTGNA